MTFIRKREVAARLGCGTTHLQKLINRGEFPPADTHLGNALNAPGLWLESHVENYINQQLQKNGPDPHRMNRHIARLNGERAAKRAKKKSAELDAA